MFKSTTLLERLSQGAGNRARSAYEDRAGLKQSILRNLQHILNARKGHAAAQRELGTPPPSELIQDYPACIERIHATIRECIARYEPRLTDVAVQYVHDEHEHLTLLFQISARLADDADRNAISFRTTVDHTGQVDLT